VESGFEFFPSTATVSGVLGGRQIGCNYQVGQWVFGVDVGYSWTNAKGNSALDVEAVDENKVKWLATATGREQLPGGVPSGVSLLVALVLRSRQVTPPAAAPITR
jgi:hypothetical protein